MRFALAVLAVGLALFAAPAWGDEVDDLLAGKPVTSAKPADDSWSESQGVHEPVVPPLEIMPLVVEQAPWDGAANPSERSVVHDSESRDDAPGARVNLVPEPSAIALAVLALVYFLVFFRRRRFA